MRLIGVAVSGGVDSMSLAVLASKVFPDVTAFIVDHQFRTESHWEANIVLQRLIKQGLALSLSFSVFIS